MLRLHLVFVFTYFVVGDTLGHPSDQYFVYSLFIVGEKTKCLSVFNRILCIPLNLFQFSLATTQFPTR